MRWEDIPYADRLTAAEHIFRVLVEHAQDGGTFRYLIYDRLGFDLDAYVPLLAAGGMEISNEFAMVAADDDNVALARKAKAAIERVAPVNPYKPGAMPAPNPDRMTLYDLVFRVEDLSKALKAEQKKRPRLELQASEKPRQGEGNTQQGAKP